MLFWSGKKEWLLVGAGAREMRRACSGWRKLVDGIDGGGDWTGWKPVSKGGVLGMCCSFKVVNCCCCWRCS